MNAPGFRGSGQPRFPHLRPYLRISMARSLWISALRLGSEALGIRKTLNMAKTASSTGPSGSRPREVRHWRASSPTGRSFAPKSALTVRAWAFLFWRGRRPWRSQADHASAWDLPDLLPRPYQIQRKLHSIHQHRSKLRLTGASHKGPRSLLASWPEAHVFVLPRATRPGKLMHSSLLPQSPPIGNLCDPTQLKTWEPRKPITRTNQKTAAHYPERRCAASEPTTILCDDPPCEGLPGRDVANRGGVIVGKPPD